MQRIARLGAWALWIPIYGAAVYLGLSFYFEPEQVATFWPASGLFLGLLVVRPHREWLGIILLFACGQLLADHLVTQRPLQINALFALSNMVEPVTGAALIRWRFHGIPHFNRLADVLGTALIGVVIAPALTAVLGAAVVNHYYGASYASSLQIWWAADALGILTVAPVVIQGGSLEKWRPHAWLRPPPATIAIASLTCSVVLFVFFAPMRPARSVVDHPYIVFPLLIWAALRLSPRAVSMIGFAISCMVVIATDRGVGPFMHVGESTHERVLAVQMFLAVSVLSASILCAVVRERFDEERRREALEDQLRQSQKMEAVGQLAGGVAHDFNNLLMVIQANLDLATKYLRGDAEDRDEVIEHVQQADLASDRAAALTRQLLLFSRRHPVRRENLDLDEVLGGLRPMLQRLIGEHIEIHFYLNGSLPQISADRGQMEQVVLNLVINARDAMPKGGRAEIRTAWSGDDVRLTVTDTGDGISVEDLPRIFEPFYSTKAVGKGTGLGLATVHGIVTGNDGSIDVDSEWGVGTSFHIHLPAVESEQLERLRPSSGSEDGTETVLVCEDEAALRPVLRRALEDGGYRVLVARDADEALRLADSGDAIDMLVTDVVMPGMDGRQLANRFLLTHPNTPVLFISGYPAHGALTDGDEIDEFMLLEKPFRAQQLRERVRFVLDQR